MGDLTLENPCVSVSDDECRTSRRERSLGYRLKTSSIQYFLWLSRLNCFHVRYGMSGSLRNLKPIGSPSKDGYTDFHFRGDVKTTYDQDALEKSRATILVTVHRCHRSVPSRAHRRYAYRDKAANLVSVILCAVQQGSDPPRHKAREVLGDLHHPKLPKDPLADLLGY